MKRFLFKCTTFICICFMLVAFVSCGQPTGGNAGTDNTGTNTGTNSGSNANTPEISMKSGSDVNACILALGAGEGELKSFKPSATAPAAGVATQTLSENNSTVEVVAWLDDDTIWYYAAGYTDTDGKKIPLDNYSYDLFENCSKLKEVDISKLDASNSKSIWGMFYGCSALETIIFGDFDTSKAESMNFMFYGCKSLTSLDLSCFNTSKVTTMRYMFEGCTSLVSLNLSSFNTENVKDMFCMFKNCSSLTTLDLSSFDTSNLTSMQSMFYGCEKLESLDVTSFDTTNVTGNYGMSSTFSHCSSLETLDLSSFDTSNVKYMGGMFASCSKLKTIYAAAGADWSGVESSSYMFSLCKNLKGGAGTTYVSTYYDAISTSYDATYAKIDGGPDNPGYFTVKQ